MRNLMMLCLLCICLNQSIAAQCQSGNPPMIIRDEPNWNFKINKDKPITDESPYSLDMTLDFLGNDLRYSYKVKGGHTLNDVQLDSKTGKLDIRADFPENFDITVTATNDCGSAEMTFKVNIAPASNEEATAGIS